MCPHVTLLQVSYGIRFDDQPSANAFLEKLANEVSARLKDQGCKGKTLQLGLKRQKPVSHSHIHLPLANSNDILKRCSTCLCCRCSSSVHTSVVQLCFTIAAASTTANTAAATDTAKTSVSLYNIVTLILYAYTVVYCNALRDYRAGSARASQVHGTRRV
jgi:impB/mucB/samB family C-terminal domain